MTDARKIDRLSYDEMQEMAEAGARVLNTAAVQYAKRAGITIRSVSTFAPGSGTVVGDFYEEARTGLVRAVVFEREIVYVVSDDLFSREEITGILDFLDDEAADYKQFDLKTYGGGGLSFTFILSLENVHAYQDMRQRLASRFPKRITFFEEWGALSLVGEGINDTGRNVKKALSLLSERGIPVHDVHTSRFRISALRGSGENRRGGARLSRRLYHRYVIRPAFPGGLAAVRIKPFRSKEMPRWRGYPSAAALFES